MSPVASVITALIFVIAVSRAFVGATKTLSALSRPILVLAVKVTTALAFVAEISVFVSPPSVIEPLSEVMATALAVAFVVVRPPRATSSSAERVIVPVPEFMVEPSAMVIAPPVPAGVLSSSAVTVIFPLPEAKAPAAAKTTSSEAETEVVPAEVTVPLTVMELSVSAVKVPPIVEVAKPKAVVVLFTTALPVVPEEFNETLPVEAN